MANDEKRRRRTTFVIRISGFFRHSDFVIRHFQAEVGQVVLAAGEVHLPFQNHETTTKEESIFPWKKP